MSAPLWDEHGTPLHPHPRCRACGEDEIGSHCDDAWCHACGWRGSLRALRTLAALLSESDDTQRAAARGEDGEGR